MVFPGLVTIPKYLYMRIHACADVFQSSTSLYSNDLLYRKVEIPNDHILKENTRALDYHQRLVINLGVKYSRDVVKARKEGNKTPQVQSPLCPQPMETEFKFKTQLIEHKTPLTLFPQCSGFMNKLHSKLSFDSNLSNFSKLAKLNELQNSFSTRSRSLTKNYVKQETQFWTRSGLCGC